MQKRIGRAVRPAALYAGVMLTLFPLYYQNYYYDINTCKYRLFLWLTLALAVATGAAFLWRLCRRRGVHPALGVTDGCMAAFVLCAAISCALCADPMDALTGDRGRHSGLLYLLAIGTMTLCLARRGGGYRGRGQPVRRACRRARGYKGRPPSEPTGTGIWQNRGAPWIRPGRECRADEKALPRGGTKDVPARQEERCGAGGRPFCKRASRKTL